MGAVILNGLDANINMQHGLEQKTKVCEYDGLDYPVIIDMKGKSFIEVSGEKKYLNKNGKVSNKQPGKRNAKDCMDSYEDMKKIYSHLIQKKRWN